MLAPSIPGYDYGMVQRSPVTADEFKRLQRVVGFTDDDQQALRKPRQPASRAAKRRASAGAAAF
jgi:hypothetical protein